MLFARITSMFACGAAAVALGAVPACSSGDKTSVDNLCAFAEDNNNCWRQLVGQVEACAGQLPSGEQGALNADGTTCTYPSGRVIQFAVPLVANVEPTSKDFTMTVGGRQCLHYVEGADGSLSITGPDGRTIRETSDGQTGAATLTCPDGASFNGSGMSILNCFDASLGGGLPGSYYSWSTSFSSLGLLGDGTVYECASSG